MSTANGTVVSATARTPLPELYVSAYFAGGDPAREQDWVRLASGFTDVRGVFSLSYELADLRQRGQAAFLVLVVATARPRDGGEVTRLVVEHRPDPTDHERFLFRIAEAQLLEAGETPRDSSASVDVVLETRRRSRERLARFDREEGRHMAAAMSQHATQASRVEEDLDRLVERVSSTGARPDELQLRTRVGRHDSVYQANVSTIRAGIEQTVNTSTQHGRLFLDGDQLTALQDSQGQLSSVIPAEALMALIRPQSKGDFLDLYHGPPLADLCTSDLPRDPCLELLKAEASGTTDDPEPGGSAPPTDGDDGAQAPAAPLTEARVAELLTALLAGAEAKLPVLDSGASTDKISEGIRDFVLHSGPADTAALHDFHHLSIAFDHVWNEVLSSRFVNASKALLSKLVDIGVATESVLGSDGGADEFKLRLPGLKAVAGESQSSPPPIEVAQVFEISGREWHEIERLGYDEELSDLATRYLDGPFVPAMKVTQTDWKDLLNDIQKYLQEVRAAKDAHKHLKQRGDGLIRYARQSIFARPRFQQFHEILEDLEKELNSPYSFKIFGAAGNERSVNFGLLSTYRQKWEPVAYQVGELVRSIPLAPKEVRKFTRKLTVNKKRAEKEVESNLRTLKVEQGETARAEATIVEKAKHNSNFSMNTNGGFNIAVASASASQAFSRSAARDSEEVKKQFREAVLKAAEEYRSERKLDVNIAADEESFVEESGEISNPNDEITVTYLFYQLQRRYRVSEALHRVRPVVLVAQEVPNPSDIDEAWLIAHEWILRRVMLDDMFLPALGYLSTRVVGDEVALQELFQNVEQQRSIAQALKGQLLDLGETERQRYRALQRSIRERADAVDEEETSGFFEDVAEFFGGSDSPSPEKMQIIEDAARDAYDRAVREARDADIRLDREVSTLNSLTETYSRALSEHLNRRAQIARLIVHVKDNIIYYMQAIWAHEPPDQRFMRLKDVRVPKLEGTLSYALQADPDAVAVPPKWQKPLSLEATCTIQIPTEFEPLSKVAAVDELLGFKGNYMILPLKDRNVLTDYMMTPYLDSYAGLRDPDVTARWSLHDFGRYVCCLRQELSDEDFAALRPGLAEAYRAIITSPRSASEEIIVPTDSLFIEALPGKHPVLEDFKLLHRVLDVRKVQADIRADELENVRAAARILAGELDDPDVDKRIEIHGGSTEPDVNV